MKTELTAVFTVRESDADNDGIKLEINPHDVTIEYEESRDNKRVIRRLTLEHAEFDIIANAREQYGAAKTEVGA